MSQRNFQNARNQGGGPKGKSKKSASSAKIKTKAGSSVYVKSKDAKNKGPKTKARRQTGKPLEEKASDPQEQIRRRERAMVSLMKDMPEYKKWRRLWWIFMAMAFISVIVTWIPTVLVQNGTLDSSWEETTRWLSSVGFVFAIVALIGAFYVDLRKIRKLQKAQEQKARNLSKDERRKLDKAIARAIEKDNLRREQRKGRSFFSRSKKGSDETASASDSAEKE